MKKVFIFAALAMASLTGCDKVTHDFTVENVKFNFEAVTVDGATTKSAMTGTAADAQSSFSVTREVSLAEIGSTEFKEYLDRISKVMVDNSLLEVTFNPAGVYTIYDLIFTAEGVSGSLVVPSYKLGDAYTAPTNLNTYMSAFIMKLKDAEKIKVTVAGKTDAPTGVRVKICYEYDLVFTAKLKSE
jgi:hypothetical protein